MKKFNFTKMVASGNDFIIAELTNLRTCELTNLAKGICNRKLGVGADGLLVLEKSRVANVMRMRIFNADGSEAEMCGNGARCTALYISRQSSVVSRQSNYKIQTKAGIIYSEVQGDNVKIKLTDPKNIKLDIPIKVNPVRNSESIRGKSKISNGVNNRTLQVNFINTGVPHAVIFVEGLDEIHIEQIGRVICHHKRFSPRGTNVDFVEALGKDLIAIRTYERGVEEETLACGTGTVAGALIYAIRNTRYTIHRINVLTRSGEILKVYFQRDSNKFKNIWLEGKARIVYKGEYNV